MSIRTLVSVVLSSLFLISLPFSASAAVTFQGGWEQGVLTGPGSWSSKQAVGAYSIQLVSDVVRAGSKAMRVEVRSGDNPLNCCASSERAELTIMTNPNGSDLLEGLTSGTKYYGFSVRLEPNFQFPEWSLLFQLHGPDYLDAYPLVAIGVDADGYNLDHFGGDTTTAPRIHRALGPVTPGQWVDFILKVTFAKDATGEITVWRRNEGETTFTQMTTLTNIPTLQYRGTDPVGGHYWKMGYYRSKQSFTNVLWNDGVTRADTFEEAVAALSGTTTPPASAFPLTVEAESFQTKVGGNGNVSGVWNLNSNGYIAQPITFDTAGTYIFDLVARGTKAAGVWANMRVSIDNVVKSNVNVNSTTLKTFRVTVPGITAGVHTLKLEFTNDYYNPAQNEDRNLLIDKAIVAR